MTDLRELARVLASGETPQVDRLTVALDAAIETTHAERGFVVRSPSNTDPLQIEVARGILREPIAGDPKLASRTVVARVLERDQGLVTSSLEDRHVTSATSVRTRHVLSILCVPLGDRRVLYLDHRFVKEAFFALDLPALETFARNLATAVSDDPDALEAAEGAAAALARVMAHREQSSEELQRVLLVDDQPFVRQATAQLIERESDLTVCAVADGGPDVLKVVEAANPDLVLIHFAAPETDALGLVKDLKAYYSNLPLLVISSLRMPIYAERILRAGARGFLTHQESPAQVMTAIRRALDGEVTVSDRIASRILSRLAGTPGDDISSLECLSDRELQVFGLIGRGYGTRRIAERLQLSVKTIETYRGHIRRKLGLRDGTELAHAAFHWSHEQDLP